MVDSAGKILHASVEGVHVLRFLGDVRYPLSPALEPFLDRLFADDEPVGFVVDLTEAESIDSTYLGVIARIANRMRKRDPRYRVTLVSTRPDLNVVLFAMGFDRVFDIVECGKPLPAEERAVPLGEASRETMGRTVLDAHRALMALSGRNRELFRDVVSLLEREGSGDAQRKEDRGLRSRGRPSE